MAYFTGENGAINSVPCLTRYRVSDMAIPATGVCSASSGAQFALAGNSDWRAVAVAYGATPATSPGSFFNFTCFDGQVGYTSGANGAYMDKVRIFWDVENAEIVYHQLFITGTAALTADVTATDATSPDPVSAIGMGSSVAGASFDIRRAMLEISCPGAPFVDSGSTNGVVERLQGNFMGAFEFEAYTKAVLPTKNALVAFTIDASAVGATKWDMSYMLITEAVSEMVKADPQGRAQGNSCKLSGIWSSYSGGTEGHILTPDGSYIFGSA